jgi:hypothetical protein
MNQLFENRSDLRQLREKAPERAERESEFKQALELELCCFSDLEILQRTDRLVKSERKITHLVLKYINEIDSRKLFLKLGYESLHRYLVAHQKYSDDQAYARTDAAAVLQKCAVTCEKIENGKITLSQLKKVGQCLRQERKLGREVTAEITLNILSQIENKSVFETEKVLAVEMNYVPKVHQRVHPQVDGSVRAELTFTKAQFEILKRAQELISHSVPSHDLAEVITHLATLVIKKADGKLNCQKSNSDSDTLTKCVSEDKAATKTTQSFSERPRSRKYISVKIKRAIRARAGNCCEHLQPTSGVKCESRFQLQIDHVIPKAKGGGDEIENLRLLCGVHNRGEAFRWGLSKPR